MFTRDRKLFSIVTLATVCLLLTGNAVAQNSTGGSTPIAMAGGAPAGSYSLSDFDNVNLFNGDLNFRLPLLTVGGRGSAHHTVVLPIEKKWTTAKLPTDNPAIYAWALEEYTAGGYPPGYGPGVLKGHYSGFFPLPCRTINDFSAYSQTLTKLTFTTGDDTEYQLLDQRSRGNLGLINNPCDAASQSFQAYNRGKVFVSNDGTGVTFISDSDIIDLFTPGTFDPQFPFSPSGYLLLGDGTRYRIDNGLTTWIHDRNHNYLYFDYDGSGRVRSIRDSLNRRVTINYGVTDSAPYGTCDQITYSGFGGASRTIRISYDRLHNALRTTQPGDSPAVQNIGGSGTDPYDPIVVSSLWLPDTSQGRRYRFYYDTYGELARAELPTGGAFEYDYGPGLVNSHPDGTFEKADAEGGTYTQVYRRVLERRVYPNGGTSLESRMTYSRPETWNSSNYNITNQGYVGVQQFDGGGALLTSEKHYFSGSASPSLNQLPGYTYDDGSGLNNKEWQTEIYDNVTLTLLRRVTMSWENWTLFGQGPHLTETVTTLDTGQVSKQSSINPQNPNDKGFDQYNNQTDLWEYDFGQGAPGPLRRHTHTDYLTSNSVNGLAYDAINPNATAPNLDNTIYLRNLPARQSIYDAAGIEQARTTYEYDNYTQDAAGHHDQLRLRTNPSGLCLRYDTGGNCLAQDDVSTYSTRGNLTATQHYLLSAQGAMTGSITSYQQYDMLGNVVKTIDPRGHATSLDYDDDFGAPDNEALTNSAPADLGATMSYAFATKMTNALGQIAYTQYDYSTGKAVNSQDANNVVASADYSDPLDRQKLVIRDVNNLAGKSETVINYDDVNRIVTISTDLNNFGDGLLKSETLYDKLGRTIETRKYETATSYITTKQDYDALGRAKRSYNSYRSTSDSTYGWSETSYDALSRVKRVESFASNGSFNLDGTPAGGISTGVVQTDYPGNSVKVMDQDNKSRQSTTDALGRLRQVIEDPTGLNYQTTYDYDALDNLITVTQGPPQDQHQTRTFAYDSLKRLISATNPEVCNSNGVPLPVTYEYYNSGSLKNKVDARSITTHFEYDALERVVSKTYLNDSSGTPPVYYYYDSQALPQGIPQNFSRGASTGRMVAVLYGSSQSTIGNYYGYDALGRVKQNYQKTNDGTRDQTYSFPNYGYDLAGNMISQTYPSGRILKTEYDQAGRIAGVNNNGSFYYAGGSPNSQDATYSNRFSYTAHGDVSDVRLGNGLWEHTAFNSRLQPTEIDLGTSTGSIDRLKLSYDYGTSNNNGNVRSQMITIPTIGGNQGFAATQIYTYDAVNRLRSAQELNGQTQVWKQSYTYLDQSGNNGQFGNRRIDVGMDEQGNPKTTDNVKPLAVDNPTISAVTNRYDAGQSYVYDDAGNLTNAPNSRFNYTATTGYDAENRQISYDNPQTIGIVDATYSYDGEGRRVKKVFGGTTTVFVYNIMGQLVAEYSNAQPTNNGTSYLTTDTLGTPRIITGTNINNESGGVINRHDYLPFGEEVGAGIGGRTTGQGYSQPDGVRQNFTGSERDDETGLDFMQARYYANIQGRFMSVDPVVGLLSNPQSLNRYSYGLNNPLKFVDPTGMTVEWADSEKKKKKGEAEERTNAQRKYENNIAKLLGSNNAEERARGERLQATYQRLKDSKAVFRVVKEDAGDSSSGELKFNGTVFIVSLKGNANEYGAIDLNQKIAHEFEHGRQVLDRELSYHNYNPPDWKPFALDRTDEAKAFAAGFDATPVAPDQGSFLNGMRQAIQLGGIQGGVDFLGRSNTNYRSLPAGPINVAHRSPAIYEVPK